MSFFCSMNIFIIDNLKSLFSKSNIWSFLRIVSIDCFYSCVELYFSVSLHIFFFKMNILNNIICNPRTHSIVVVLAYVCVLACLVTSLG